MRMTVSGSFPLFAIAVDPASTIGPTDSRPWPASVAPSIKPVFSVTSTVFGIGPIDPAKLVTALEPANAALPPGFLTSYPRCC